jgi:hypothetical protein
LKVLPHFATEIVKRSDHAKGFEVFTPAVNRRADIRVAPPLAKDFENFTFEPFRWRSECFLFAQTVAKAHRSAKEASSESREILRLIFFRFSLLGVELLCWEIR